MSAVIVLAVAKPVEYDELTGEEELADDQTLLTDPSSIYDTVQYTRYSEGPTDLDYQPPNIGELPLEVIREKRDTGNNESKNDDATIDVNKNFFESLFEFTRPQRKANDTGPITSIPLDGLVHAVENTLLNSAKGINAKAVHDETSTTTSTTVPSSTDENKNRFVRSYAENNLDKHIDEETENEEPFDFDAVKDYEGEIGNLELLRTIVNRDLSSQELTTAETAATITVPTESTTDHTLHTNITLVKSTNTTHVIPSKSAIHVQTQSIQQSVFSSDLAILPTISSDKLNIPTTSSKEVVNEAEPLRDESSKASCSLESGSGDSSKSDESLQCKPSTSEETIESIKEDINLLKKTQKLKEQIAEVEADPVILSQGI